MDYVVAQLFMNRPLFVYQSESDNHSWNNSVSSAVDVVLHAAAASCECSNSSLACSSNLVSSFSSSSSEHLSMMYF